MFVQVAKEISAFVTRAKGIEKRHNMLHMSDPISRGGLRLYHIYWPHRMKFLSLLQHIIRDPSHVLPQMSVVSVHHKIRRLHHSATTCTSFGNLSATRWSHLQLASGLLGVLS